MFRILYRGAVFGQLKNNSSSSLKRFFLSDAFKCTEAWENRLKSPVFQTLQCGSLYSDLEKNFANERAVNILDVDIFISGIVEESYQNELEDVLEKLRECPETSLMLERTSHAAIRSLFSWDQKSNLLNILSQRLIYGLFPDIYLTILMIDTFLKENDVISAVKIAVLQMLQEDCNHPILNGLSLYSCIKYLNSPDVWVTPKEGIDPDEEVVKVRVEFARNEHYDDHFDIVDTNHLVGKAMCAFGKTVEGPIGASCQLIGLVIYEKFDDGKTLVSNIIENNLPIHKEAVEKAKTYILKKPKQVEEGEKAEESSGEKNDESSVKVELTKLLDELSSKNLLSDPLDTVLDEYVKKSVSEHEGDYIKKQCEIYKKWEEDRAKDIEEEMINEKKRSVKREIEKLKHQLEEEEKKLFFYDLEEEYDEIVEEKIKERENVEYYVPRNKKKAIQHETYVPPPVKRRTT